MKDSPLTSTAERLGRALGRTVHTLLQLDRSARIWLVSRGLPGVIANGVVWTVRLVVAGTLLYVISWAVLIFVVLLAISIGSSTSPRQPDEEWAIGDQAKHRKSVFYDPRHYNDDPDSRFDDD